MQVDVADGNVACCILRAYRPQRAPSSDIAPAGIRLHDQRIGSCLHHGVIDGIRGAYGKAFPVEPPEVEVPHAVSESVRRGREHGGLEALQLIQVPGGGKAEHPAIPHEATALDETYRSGPIRLLA